MADLFLTKTRISPSDLVEAGGRPVLERHAELHALLSDRAGPATAALFAAPLVSRGNDAAPPTVSWYAQGTGEARPLSALSGEERDRVAAHLAEHLRPLRALAGDRSCADLVLGALSVLGAEDVMVVDGRPVIVNWGLLPGGGGANVSARPAHYAATLGRYLPLDLGRLTGAAPDEPVSPAAADPRPAVAATGARPPAAAITAWAWAPLLVLLVLAGLVLAWLLMPGTRIFPRAAPAAIDDQARLAAQQALNAELRARRDQLQAALEGAMCRPDGVLVLPDGFTPDGLLPPPPGTAPPERATARPDAILPSPAERLQVGPDDAGQTLLDWIEARSVLVLARGAEGLAVGSGLVVAPGRVLTNHHVVAGADRVTVASAALAAPVDAQVLASDGPLAETGDDFALLDIGEAELPAFALHVAGDSLKLHQVIAAGYPGDVLELDPDFAALRAGQAGAMPGLTVTDGIVNTEQEIGPGTRVLMHSAPLSAGNSGGPLVDMCGRVVGINSFVRKGPLQNRGYALPAAAIVAFLQRAGVAPALDDSPCAPVVIRPQVAAGQPREGGQ